MGGRARARELVGATPASVVAHLVERVEAGAGTASGRPAPYLGVVGNPLAGSEWVERADRRACWRSWARPGLWLEVTMEASNLPSVVFLFGAGASADLNVPMMAGFRQQLEAVAARHDATEWLQLLLDDLRIGSRCGDDNLESIWSRLDMACAVGVPRIEQRRREFVALVGEAYRPSSRREKICAYLQLISALCNALGADCLCNDSMTFVTFNQDTALDCALYRGVSKCGLRDRLGRERLRYWLGRKGEECRAYPPRLLKLHGSMNWGACEDPSCGSGVRFEDEFRSYPAGWAYMPCQYHGEDKTRAHVPLVVGPSWLRQPHGHNLRRVWARAYADLKAADLLIVVGHSFPASDVYFDHFLSLATTRRSKAKPLKFLVVDTNPVTAACYAVRLKQKGCAAARRGGILAGRPMGCFARAIPKIVGLVRSTLGESQGRGQAKDDTRWDCDTGCEAEYRYCP
jgi:NAD-dependent SIR2 family protein deacetylase